MNASTPSMHREPWKKGKLVGQKAPLKLKEIWAIRVRLQLQHRVRDLALFNHGIDSKLAALPAVPGQSTSRVAMAQATRTPPVTCETLGPPGSSFSHSTSTDKATIQNRFMTPPTNRSAMSSQQQPTQ